MAVLVTPALLFATLCHLPQIGHQCHPNHKSFLIPIPSIPKPNRSYSSPILLSFTSKPATISSEKLEACHLLHPVGIHLKIIKSYNKQIKQYLGDHSKLINSPCTIKKGSCQRCARVLCIHIPVWAWFMIHERVFAKWYILITRLFNIAVDKTSTRSFFPD